MAWQETESTYKEVPFPWHIKAGCPKNSRASAWNSSMLNSKENIFTNDLCLVKKCGKFTHCPNPWLHVLISLMSTAGRFSITGSLQWKVSLVLTLMSWTHPSPATGAFFPQGSFPRQPPFLRQIQLRTGLWAHIEGSLHTWGTPWVTASPPESHV